MPAIVLESVHSNVMIHMGYTDEDRLQRNLLLKGILLVAIEMNADNLKQTLDVPPWEARKKMLHGRSMNQVLLLPVVELT